MLARNMGRAPTTMTPMSRVPSAPSRSIEMQAERFLVELAAGRGASVHTLRAYRSDLKEFVAFLATLEIDDAKSVSPRVLRAYLMELDERGLARTSVQRKLSGVRSFFQSLVELHQVGAQHARPDGPQVVDFVRDQEGLQFLQVPAIGAQRVRRDAAPRR